MTNVYKTAESVTPSHPDKVCDQISDAVLDACLTSDPSARSAIEVVGGHGLIHITGELTTTAVIDVEQIAREVYRDCGYTDDVSVTQKVVTQSPEIKAGVDTEGAGDQGIMVGYATSETAERMPLEVVLARKLTKAMGKRDGKAQVTTRDGTVVKIVTSVCEQDGVSDEALHEILQTDVAQHIQDELTVEDVWLQNPNGRWTVGGFAADTGLTGRKLAVDNYGPDIPIGGGAFSGKDATKVDRSAAYMARKIAVEYLIARGAREVFVRLAYAIGVAEPVMAAVTVDGVQEEIIGYDLTPRGIIEYLELRKPQYRATAAHGHFGNSFRWE